MKTYANSETCREWALIWSTRSNGFALVTHRLGTAMLTVGNTEGFNRLSLSPKPAEIVIEQTASGKCDVVLKFSNATLRHSSGRVEAKKLADALGRWTGSKVFNQKKAPRGHRRGYTPKPVLVMENGQSVKTL